MPIPTLTRRAAVLGGAVAFTPAALPSLAFWFDATKLAGFVDGDAITTWPDVSGLGRDLTQATGASKPTYKTAVQNGLPVARFDGGDTVKNTFNLSALTAMTVVLAGMGTTFAAQQTFCSFGSVASAVGSMEVRLDTSTGKFTGLAKGDVGLNSYTTTPAATANTWLVGSVVIDFGAVAASEVRAFLNTVGTGAQTGTNDNASTFNAAQPFSLGSRGGSGSFMTGDLGELVVYGSALSAGDRARVESYLKTKWGTP